MRINPINYNTINVRSLKINNKNQAQRCTQAGQGAQFNKTPVYFCSANNSYSPDNTPETSLLKGQITTDDGKVFNKHTTFFFRKDLDWIQLGKYINKKYCEYPKVNCYVWGCSSGQEAYGLSMVLKKVCENPEKFYPIQAFDIDKRIIDQNIKRISSGLKLRGDDVQKICTNLDINDYNCSDYLDITEMPIKISNNIVDSVQFAQSNIVTDLEKNTDSSKPSILMCRNMWPYIDSSEYNDIAKRLYDALAPGSIIIIGNFDYTGDIECIGSKQFPAALSRAGFKPNSHSLDITEERENANLIFEKPLE